jgi:hypothetical protein
MAQSNEVFQVPWRRGVGTYVVVKVSVNRTEDRGFEYRHYCFT